MKNLLILFCSLLLSGVFGETDDGNMSVKEGDSVTLKIKPQDINRAEDLRWRFNDTIIAKIDLEGKDKPPVYPDEKRFRDRLKLERENGSLTITHITSEHSGVYQLEIRRSQSTYKTFRVSVIDIVTSVLVMDGENVILHTHQKTDDVKWMFNGADLTGHINSSFTNSEVNPQTGDLNISNIRRNQSGKYEVRINGSSFTLHRTYGINVSDKMNTVSVMEGDSFTLTGVTDGKIDDVKWKFNGDVIADLTGHINSSFTNSKVNHQTGDLNISNIRRNQTGKYEVRINGSSFTLHRTYGVNVSVEPESVSGNVGADLTLCHNFTDIQRDDVIQWTFEGTLIAHSNRKPNIVSNDDRRFSDRLRLEWAGCLIINNFRSKDSGLYDVNITGSKHILHKSFSVTGVFGETDDGNMSVKEGDSVTLKIKPQDINRAEDLRWRFNDTIIAKIDLEGKDKPPVYPDEKRFRDRLKLERENGSLTITHITSEHSGVYQLEIRRSQSTYKTFRVSVSAITEPSQMSHWMITGPVLAVAVVLLLVGVLYVIYKRYKKQKSQKEENETAVHLKNDIQ
ncbi:uncharacterized protein LOC130549640 isoform X2 [Triplophysa rosa]|uniref:uncharacterized protein LOC130549640 isoform X2 n=1 Tax=Triplophysa rosa TaxID=992332 RepID=UPI0025462561|nr:uncharacterized protein LOC130549640 isoform X2 [Triplophysa rosa]